VAHHHRHHHTGPIGPPPPKSTPRLPGNKFGALVGVLDHLTLSAHDGTHPDDNHVYIWIRVPAGPVTGKYECAFNTESSSTGSQTQFAVKEEAIQLSDVPENGFSSAAVSYHGLGLKQTDFQPIKNGVLRTSVFDWANKASVIAAYGVTYPGGDGLHEIHMNSGEPPGSPHPKPFRRWVFIKFSTQTL
jgi:hypothetical protein